MTLGQNPAEDAAENTQEDFLRQLRQTFAQFSNEIPLYLFSEKGKGDDVYVEATRQVIRVFRNLTSKITVKEYTLDHELAKKWKVDSSPTLLIDPDRYNIRWVGAPIGEEGRSFLEAMILIGLGKSNVSDQSRSVLERIDAARNVKIFVSPTCPYCPQQVVNGLKAAIERPEIVFLEIIDIQCRPDLAEKYNAHSVPQAYANETLIGQGAQQEEVFMFSMHKLDVQTLFIPESTDKLVKTDVVIVGGGPAGLSAGIYTVRSGLKTALIERDALGGQVALTPVVENYPGFMQVGGKTLVDIMVQHTLEHVQIYQGEEVLEIKPGETFELQTTRRKFHTKTVLLATGATHRHLGVSGEKRLSGRGVSYCSTCDGPLFKAKKVIIVGGGNSAVTEALHLRHIGVDVTLVHRRDKLRAQDVLANQLNENGIEVLWNTQVHEIKGKERVQAVILKNNRTGESSEMAVDGVFVAIGYIPAVELAKKTGLELNPEGYIRHDGYHRTNIAGIYSAGDVEGGYKQIVIATGQGAAAAMTIFEDLINPYWKKEQAC
ncbi:MAG: FAD-dependent oxidoreductase [Desulfobacteraceae bacterium]|nr:FAD-dependent oxidoreductase [Desulfobacteraceae bacterium]